MTNEREVITRAIEILSTYKFVPGSYYQSDSFGNLTGVCALGALHYARFNKPPSSHIWHHCVTLDLWDDPVLIRTCKLVADMIRECGPELDSNFKDYDTAIIWRYSDLLAQEAEGNLAIINLLNRCLLRLLEEENKVVEEVLVQSSM